MFLDHQFFFTVLLLAGSKAQGFSGNHKLDKRTIMNSSPGKHSCNISALNAKKLAIANLKRKNKIHS
jgi:hypothetical protein